MRPLISGLRDRFLVMGNALSSTPSEGQSSAQLNSNIEGDYSGNTGYKSIFGSGNTTTTNNHFYGQGGRNAPEDYTQILQVLYPPGSGYESHLGRVQEPVEGTCTWVIEHPKYKEWLENESSGLLWLSADQGCGKSVIASFLVKHLKIRPDAIVCYFFFRDDSEEQSSAIFALRAILHQLFVQRDTLCSYAEKQFKAKGERFAEEVDTLWNILVKAVAEGGCGDVICVVDALDECGEETLAPLIRRITRFPQSQASDTPLKFLVTSRPYHNIEKVLGSRTTTIRLKGEDEVTALTADVTRVIDNGINDLEFLWGNPGGLEYLRNLLASSTDRTFLWASLVLEILHTIEDDSPEEFANIVSAAPLDLMEFYTKILDNSPDPDKASRVLNIVVGVTSPPNLQIFKTLNSRSQTTSTTGSWNTQDVRSWTELQQVTSKKITFGKSFVAPPRLPLGLNWLDIGNSANIRVVATATDITKESFKASINTWGETALYSAGASWAELAPGNMEYQNGEFSTQDDHPWNKPQLETSRRIIFDRPFITPPKVIVFLKQLDIERTRNCRVTTKVSDIDANGFTIYISTWGDSILYLATAGWIAFPEDHPYVFGTTARTQDVRPYNQPRHKNSREIDFSGLKFRKTPSIFMAINHLDFDNRANLRIKVQAKDVTKTGMTWCMDSWGDSIFYSAGVSILAMV